MLNRIREARKNEHGFTLIELLIVIVILGILAAIVVFSVAGIQDRGKTSACKADKATVTTAVEAYYAKNEAYPTTAEYTAGALTTAPNKFIDNNPADVTYTGTATSYTVAGVGC